MPTIFRLVKYYRHSTLATFNGDPASGSFPMGCLIVNVSDGGLKRHAGALSWEI